MNSAPDNVVSRPTIEILEDENDDTHKQPLLKRKAPEVDGIHGLPVKTVKNCNRTPGLQPSDKDRTILMNSDVTVLLNLERQSGSLINWMSARFVKDRANITEKKAKSVLDNLSKTVYVDKRGQYSHEYNLTNIGTMLNAKIRTFQRRESYYEPLTADYSQESGILQVEDSTWLAIDILHNLKKGGHSRKELARLAKQQDAKAVAEVIEKLKSEKYVLQSDVKEKSNLIYSLSDQGFLLFSDIPADTKHDSEPKSSVVRVDSARKEPETDQTNQQDITTTEAEDRLDYGIPEPTDFQEIYLSRSSIELLFKLKKDTGTQMTTLSTTCANVTNSDLLSIINSECMVQKQPGVLFLTSLGRMIKSALAKEFLFRPVVSKIIIFDRIDNTLIVRDTEYKFSLNEKRILLEL